MVAAMVPGTLADITLWQWCQAPPFTVTSGNGARHLYAPLTMVPGTIVVMMPASPKNLFLNQVSDRIEREVMSAELVIGLVSQSNRAAQWSLCTRVFRRRIILEIRKIIILIRNEVRPASSAKISR